MKEIVFIGHGDLMLDNIYDENYKLIRQEGGGCNWNTLYNLAYHGERCYAIGGCGKDKEGEQCINSLQKVGVNTDYIIKENKRTNIMNIIIPNKNLEDNSIRHAWHSPVTNELTINFSKNLPTCLPTELEDKEIYIVIDRVRKVNLDFINNINNKNVCLDIGHIKYIRYFNGKYLLNFLQQVKLLLLNKHASAMLYNKLKIKDEIELFKLLKLDLLILTNGREGAKILFNENGNFKIIEKTPNRVEVAVDNSGVGDAFFSAFTQYYSKTNKIDSQFVENTFNIADKRAREIIKQIGSRKV